MGKYNISEEMPAWFRCRLLEVQQGDGSVPRCDRTAMLFSRWIWLPVVSVAVTVMRLGHGHGVRRLSPGLLLLSLTTSNLLKRREENTIWSIGWRRS